MLQIIQTKDQGATFVNKCETEEGGEEKLLSEMPSTISEMKDNQLSPFVGNPSINGKYGTLHIKMAIRPTVPMQRGYEQKEYLWPIYNKFNITHRCSFIYDECQEIYQHRIAVLTGQPSVFNKREARFDLIKKPKTSIAGKSNKQKNKEKNMQILILK